MTNIENMCPHTIKLIVDGHEIEIPPTGLARCAVTREAAGFAEFSGMKIPLTRTTYGEVTGLPAAVEGTIYLVSGLVRAQSPDRTDLVSPDQMVRDDDGNVVGAGALAFS